MCLRIPGTSGYRGSRSVITWPDLPGGGGGFAPTPSPFTTQCVFCLWRAAPSSPDDGRRHVSATGGLQSTYWVLHLLGATHDRLVAAIAASD